MWLQVIKLSLILLLFLGIFIHFWRPFGSEFFYLYQNFTYCLSNQYWYVKVPDVNESYVKSLILLRFLRIMHNYGTLLVFIVFLGYFHTLWYVDMPDVTLTYVRFSGLVDFFGYLNLIILHQTFINFLESLWKIFMSSCILFFYIFFAFRTKLSVIFSTD